MTHEAKAFLELRTKIIKNAIYNKLLTATLQNAKSVTVGEAIIRVSGKLKRYILDAQGSRNAKMARFVCVSISVSIDTYFTVSFSYKDFPAIEVKKIPFSPVTNTEYLKLLKKLSVAIYDAFPIHASKLDKIFSRHPMSLSALLEASNISSSLWCTGLSRKPKDMTSIMIYKAELEKYYKNLNARLNDWRTFNNILIELIKNQSFEVEQPNFGKLCVKNTVCKEWYLCNFDNYESNNRISQVSYPDTFSPPSWESANYPIDIFTLRKLMTE